MGHIRDLPNSAKEIPAHLKKKPWANLGVRMEDGIEPIYVIPKGKKKVVSELRSALKDADELLIATDEDREGEAIGWHLIQLLAPKVPVRRMVFHEITQKAILRALTNTRHINEQLVQAQEARRILDRLVGYQVSPVLWRKIAPKLSAGRVQSVAVRLLVEREKKRLSFIDGSYWSISANLNADTIPFKAKMTYLGDQRLATGRDFDDNTGELKETLRDRDRVLLLREKHAKNLQKTLANSKWTVEAVQSRDRKKFPAPPFITSTLQQEASRKFRWGAKKTMMVAQRLYEQGFITYMRTDSVQLSQEALAASRKKIERLYGPEYLSKGVRQFKNKSANAQEAHEAIRPAGTEMKEVSKQGLTGEEARLYDLIWKRTVASQMAEAHLKHTTVTISAQMSNGESGRFSATGQTILFDGFLVAYVEGSDDPEAALESKEKHLPPLKAGQELRCLKVEPKGHKTKPPNRYTEASLIKKLEQEGVGRPSTYATIISNIKNKGSALSQGRSLAPTFTAFAINQLLEANFQKLVDYGFTANMEKVLDDIASGQRNYEEFLLRFDQGEEGLKKHIQEALDKVDPREISKISSPKWGPCIVRVGRYGPYAEATINGVVYKGSLPPDLLPADVTEENLLALVQMKKKEDRILGKHPETKQNVVLKDGRFGPYVELSEPDNSKKKPRRASLLKDMLPSRVDLDDALQLLSFPRKLGLHPETGQMVTSHLGRYGPYIKHQRLNVSVGKENDIMTLNLDQALKLLATKKSDRGLLRTLGNGPDGKPIGLYKGRYGPYVKYGNKNASIPKDQEPEEVTLEQALKLLEAKAKKKPVRRRKRRAR